MRAWQYVLKFFQNKELCGEEKGREKKKSGNSIGYAHKR